MQNINVNTLETERRMWWDANGQMRRRTIFFTRNTESHFVAQFNFNFRKFIFGQQSFYFYLMLGCSLPQNVFALDKIKTLDKSVS